jgi:hypothetical protein
MSTDQFVPILGGFTLLAVLFIAVWQLLAFLRKRRNREIAKKTLTD